MRVFGCLFLCAYTALTVACTQSATPVSTERYAPGPKPNAPRLNAAVPYGTTAFDNASLADLFVRLTHDLEWGGRRPNLVRLEQPVSVGITGCCTTDYAPFLDEFLGQLRAGTGIAIRRSAAPQNLLINLVPGADFRARVPKHLCVVAPGKLPWAQFRDSPVRFGTRAYEERRSVSAMSVYIPDTLPPHLIRRCLIEETTQALGLANDLSGLGDTIFNDDGVQIWPTALDHLMMRVLYAPEVRTGLSRQDTRRAALAALARLNPAGRSAPRLPAMPVREIADWKKQLDAAFDPGTSRSDRRRAATAALQIANARRPGSAHHCRSLRVAARFAAQDPEKRNLLNTADSICRKAHGAGDPRLDLIALDRARVLYRLGQISQAYGISQPLGPRLAAHGQSERLVALYALQAAALKAIQQPDSSTRARSLAIAWGKYALGRNHPQVQRLGR